jgi:hypothetical protein
LEFWGGGHSFVAKDFFCVFGFVCVFWVIRVGGDEVFVDVCDARAGFNQSGNRSGGRSSWSVNATLARTIGYNAIGKGWSARIMVGIARSSFMFV